MHLVFLWLVEDLLTVFTGGAAQIPELFILGVAYKILTDDEERRFNLPAIWIAFAGGILWDLRWVGIPGFFTLGYVVAILIIIQIWEVIPPQGRTSGNGFYYIVFALLEISQLLPPVLPVLILGGGTGWIFFIRQQIYSLPAILICLWLYVRKIRRSN